MITSYPRSGDEESESDEESSEKHQSPKKKMRTENFSQPKHKHEAKELKVGPQLPDNYVLEDSNSPQSLVSYGPDPGPPGAEDDNDSQSSPFGKYSLLSNVPDIGPPGDEPSVNIITNGVSVTLPNDTDSSEKSKEIKVSVDAEVGNTEKPAVDKHPNKAVKQK